jgi:uncharacterized protein YjbJ (UPF0337 family)
MDFRKLSMPWDKIEKRWNQLKGTVREEWRNLTDDDLYEVAGNRDRLLDKLQQRYGLDRDEAERQLQAWMEAMKEEPGLGAPVR